MVHILIMLKRAKMSQGVTYEPEMIRQLEESREYQIADQILTRISTKTHTDLRSETYYLTQNLMAARTLITDEAAEQDQFALTIQEIISEIDRMTNIDLSQDMMLKQGLENHLNISLNRIRFKMRIRNTFLDAMKSSYPLAFELAVISGMVIERHYQLKPDENEIGLLAIHLGAALERQGLMTKNGQKRPDRLCLRHGDCAAPGRADQAAVSGPGSHGQDSAPLRN